MNDLVITSRQNSIVKYIRGLRDKKTREAEGRFVIEGSRFVYEAVLSGAYLDKVVFSERGDKQPLATEIISHLNHSTDLIRVSDQVMDYISDTETPQGIAAVIKLPGYSLRDLQIHPESVITVIDGVQDPGNVGTIIRTADAFGAGAVILTAGCADVYNTKTLRSTMGSVFHIPVVRDAEIGELKEFFQQNNIFTAATRLDGSTQVLSEAKFIRPLAIIFGSEAKGVSQELSRDADVLLKIPMSGLAESLNVAVAAGIVLYEAFNRRGSNTFQTCK